MKSALERRRTTFLRGHRAEWIALAFLICKGYRPLARRYSAAGGEIDLIVTRGDTVAFIEVKARGLMDDALTLVARAKEMRDPYLLFPASPAWRAFKADPRGQKMLAGVGP